MTNVLKPENPDPNFTLTYSNMPLKNLISMNAVFLKFLIDSLMLQGKLF